MPAELIVVRHLNSGIYKSSGGGQSRVISRHASGPRGLANAVKSHREDCRNAALGYGNIGCGSGWIEAVPKGGQPGDGVTLDFPFDWYNVPVDAGMDWWNCYKPFSREAMGL